MFSFFNVSSPESYKIERAILFDVMGLLTMPRRIAIQRPLRADANAGRLRGGDARGRGTARLGGSGGVLQLAAYAEQVKEAADASAELARRMARAGNFSRLAQMREQTFYAEATAQLARAASGNGRPREARSRARTVGREH
ncbi:MAG: hypothetical protein IPK29_20165 [Betaproteobacteria bacterium]|nr:hypothetical protein [Betaproteobacteria bacterium]